MCRVAIYSGQPIAAERLLKTSEHSLYHQSYAPNQLLTGSVNADGYGLGWYNKSVDPRPGCYRRAVPIWSDRDLDSIGRIITGDTLLANVRNATDSSTTGVLAAHPFDDGPHLFMHNGYVENFRHSMKREFEGRLSARGYAALGSATDSEAIFQRIVDLIGDGHDMTAALLHVIAELTDLATASDLTLQLNFALSDGDRTHMTRWSNRDKANSLYMLVRGGSFPEGTVIASEPLTPDDPWTEVPMQSLVTLSPNAAPIIEPL